MIRSNIVNQYSSRWSDLDLYIPESYYPQFYGTDNHAPILKSIRFHCSDSATLKLQPLTCPCLERATLSFFPWGTELDNLTHLTLYAMSIDDSLRILRMTPRLVFCEIAGCHPGADIVRSTGALFLRSLRSLRLLVSIHFFLEHFLNNLIAPHLEEFTLSYLDHPSIEVVTSFFKRSACSLRTLTMIFSISSPYFERFMSLLQSIPSLNSLLLSKSMTLEYATPEDYDPRNILQLVAKILSSQSTSLQQRFLPNLEILKFTGELYLRPGDYSDLYSLPPVDGAVRGPFHLLELNLHPATRVPKNLISYISSLKERGVTVNVLSESEDILKSSINHYRLSEDSSRRDWIDNLDLSLFS
jgi:hypothetical protein